VCFSDAPSGTLVLAVFEDENPGGFVIPVSYGRSSNCFCPSIDLAQFIQHGKWVYFIATDLSDMNTIYACTDYIDNFYASMDLSIKVDKRLDIVTQLAPKNVYAVLEITLTAPLPFPKLPFLTLDRMCWVDTTWGRFPYECTSGYDVMIFLWIDKYCKNNNLKPPEWTDVWDSWFTYIDAEFYYEPYKIVFRKVFDETTLFNTINTGYYCTDDAGRQIPIKLTWLDIDRFVVTIYNEMFIYITTSDGTIVCRNQANGVCLTSTTGQRLDIGNPFEDKADDFNRARQLIALQLQATGTIGSTQNAISNMASAISTALLNALNLYPFYTPETPAEGLKPINESFISFLAQTVVSSIEGTISKAIRIVIKNIARTYMVLKTYFELGLSVPTSALILFLNNFLKLIVDVACKIASKCIGVVSIVLTIPYAVKRLREVAEQEYDIRKPLTSLKNMFIGFGKAARDIFTTWLASVFAGAVVCVFAKCPKLQSIQPPFISLPDWYVFEDFCADLCRTPLIEGRIRDYMTCVNRCITSIAPRSPAEKVVVTEAGRTMVYIDESIVSVDMGAYTTRPIKAEGIHPIDSLSMVVRNRVQRSASDDIKPSDAYRYTTATRTTQSLSESTSFYDSASYTTATRVARELSESVTSKDSVNTVMPSVVSRTITEGVGSSDKMAGWVPLPPITPYVRWIEAVNEYIDPYYGASMVATDVLTGEVIRVGEIGRAFHSMDMISDSAQITAKPPIYILPSESSERMFAELPSIGLIRLVSLSTPYVSILGILVPHSIRIKTAVQLATPATPLVGITVPAVSPYLRMLLMSSANRLSAYILTVHSIRTKTGVQLRSPSRLSMYASLPQGTRTKSGIQLTSPSRLSMYASLPQGTRTKSGIQLTSPARTCAQITITV